MLHFSRVVADQPTYHRAVVRISLPYTGPFFVWCQGGNGNWTWDLQFGFAVTPPPPTPDAAVGWGIHQVHPHPPEKQSNWLPRLGIHFLAGAPIARSVDHGNHKDFFQIRADAAGNDANGNPQYDIKLTFVHVTADAEPDFDPPYSWWQWWWWRLLNWVCWWRRSRFYFSSTPHFGVKPEEFEEVMNPPS